MTKEIKVVMGANFGDEGKGLMTDYFCHELSKDRRKVLNIRYNGGAQAGHNVVTPDGKQHVFSHFGAGSFSNGVDTYLSEEFILNPILFCRELNELEKLGVKPNVYIHKNCRTTTPYDMLVNQILERSRGENRHDSCGVGINETVERYWLSRENASPHAPTISDIYQKMQNSVWSFESMLKAMVSEYILPRLQILNIILTKDDLKFFESDLVLKNYIIQMNQMLSYCEIVDDDILKEYSGLVFEGGQGLLLDTDYFAFAPHLTNSKTGSYIPKKMLFEAGLQDEDIEFCYVTRSYFTRHGAGPFPTECKKEDLFKENVDEKYNHENEFQGKFRYGYFDEERFIYAFHSDAAYVLDNFPNASSIIAMTHLDETDGAILLPNKKISVEHLSHLKYLGCGETRDYVMTCTRISS